MAKIDLTGKRFGRLLVIKFDSVRGRRRSHWLCLCDCGKEKVAALDNLQNGKTKSCGCLRIEQATERLAKVPRITFEEGRGSCNFLWNRYKQGAKKRELEFDLSRDEFFKLTSTNCHYCGSAPRLKIKGHRNNGEYIFNGVDRIDPFIGYRTDNCVACCDICNYAKHDYSYADFQIWINNLVKFKTV